MIVRGVEIKKGLANIAEHFGRDVRTVKKWQRQGAPIYLVDGIWTTETAELWGWLKIRKQDEAAA